MEALRPPITITLAVWKALFLREALNRLAAGRAAWMWILLEPIIHISFIAFMLLVIRMRLILGMELIVWVTVGLLSFFLFRRPAMDAATAIRPNRALFAHRQVKPIDAVLMRASLEAFLVILVSVIVYTGVGLLGYDIVPANPLEVFQALLSLWLLAIGFGLITSVIIELVPELGRVILLSVRILYFTSGVLFPISRIPLQYRDWFLVNPLAHSLDLARLGFAPYYQGLPGTNFGYPYMFALASIFLGLALHVRFATRLATR